MHPCEDDLVCKCKTEENKVPYFNAPVYLDNKEQIGKVDEIFGQLRDFVSFPNLVGFFSGFALKFEKNFFVLLYMLKTGSKRPSDLECINLQTYFLYQNYLKFRNFFSS